MSPDDTILHTALHTVRAVDIMTRLHDRSAAEDSFDDYCDPFASVAALPDTDFALPSHTILDLHAFRIARMNQLLANTDSGEDALPLHEHQFLRPYIRVPSNTPLLALFGDTGGGAFHVPLLPGPSHATFWVVTDADDIPIGTLTADNLLRLPGRIYLLSLVLRLEQIAAEYCYRYPHLFLHLTSHRQSMIVAHSLNFDSRWHRQLEDADETLMFPTILAATQRARSTQSHRLPLLQPDDQLITAILDLLADHFTGRRMVLRLLLESTTFNDRRHMLRNATPLQPHSARFSHTFVWANKTRNRLAHPYPLMSMNYEAFWDFTEAAPLSHESLDDGHDRPIHETWPQLLGMPSLEKIREFTRAIDEALRSLAEEN